MSNEKDEHIQELSRRNAEIFNQVIKDQNNKMLEMQKQIDGLNNTISTLQERLNQQEMRINMLQIKIIGTGATSV